MPSLPPVHSAGGFGAGQLGATDGRRAGDKTMRFKAAITTNSDAGDAVRELVDAAAGVTPDLAMLFVSPHFEGDCETILGRVLDSTNARNLIGCTADGVIGPDREVENAPAIALWLANLPGVRVLPFVIDIDDVRNFDSPEDWRDRTGMQADDRPSLVLLPEPFSFGPALEHSLDQLDSAYPGSTIVGGLASGGERPDQNRLFLNDQVLRKGMVGVSLSGPVAISSVVSQGCRPIGEPLVVTKAEHNVIKELRGRPAMEILQQIFQKADPEDRALMQRGIHVGCVVDESRSNFGQGDFLIRNLMGIVGQTGIAIAALVRPGQTIQFHVRDSRSADQEMRSMLGQSLGEMGAPPEGALLFTCNGRGTHMFGQPNHDIGVVNQLASNCQVAGFFAAGEIGPVGHRTFIHGFTSSLIVFREA